ncbi:hypothetical protein VPNG_06220 [Cytospora leucostoma]|uniref:Uncharacterized protein n=1 Tax=Cytospora leucostoma TaxID=1230097 RepID=A0A423WYN5_9PEZI|nr:hypothetical protein VPNG_06220 [Cytospora leucostoma]
MLLLVLLFEFGFELSRVILLPRFCPSVDWIHVWVLTVQLAEVAEVAEEVLSEAGELRGLGDAVALRIAIAIGARQAIRGGFHNRRGGPTSVGISNQAANQPAQPAQPAEPAEPVEPAEPQPARDMATSTATETTPVLPALAAVLQDLSIGEQDEPPITGEQDEPPITGEQDEPPITWSKEKYEEDPDAMKRDFLHYYKEKGWAMLTAEGAGFVPAAHHPGAEYAGETYFRIKPVQEGNSSSDTYDEDFIVLKRPVSALPQLEEQRKGRLAGARRRLQQLRDEPDRAGKAREVLELEREVRRYQNPFEQWRPPIRMDNELNDFRDARKIDQPKDIAGNNSVRDTLHKFKPVIERMESVGAFGKEVAEVDGKRVELNRTWKEGDKWRPKSIAWADEVPSDDEATSTFHGFYPRQNRPNRVGLGHLGYDEIYVRSRDGEFYTADDLTDREWSESRADSIEFVSTDGNTFTVDTQLSSDNPALDRQLPTSKPLRQILEENRQKNTGQRPYQDRRGASRGQRGGRGPGAFGPGWGGWGTPRSGWN